MAVKAFELINSEIKSSIIFFGLIKNIKKLMGKWQR